MAQLRTRSHGTRGAEIASNSLDVTEGNLVVVVDGKVVKAGKTWGIDGIAKETKVFDADNTTVAQEKLTFYGLDRNSQFDEIVTNGTITQANVGDVYNLVAGGDSVDGATSAIGTQVKLMKVISSTVGRFIVA